MKKSKVGKPLTLPGMPHEAPESLMRTPSLQSELNLANHFLIAMPSMNDPIFGGAVVYICEHNDKGVLGVVINKPTDMTMDVLFDRIDDVAFTTSIDVLEAVANGTGPQRMLVSIGYAGWSPGQLEEEIARNGWLTVGADARVLFDLPIEERYTAAIRLLGIDPLMLATEAGHA
jgi:putative transcriptional regulator